MTNNIKRVNKLIQISLTDQYFKKIEEMCLYMGLTKAELFRRLVDDYYFDYYRPKVFGNQAGIETAKKRLARADKKESIEGKIYSLDAWDDEEINSYLWECGYNTKEEEETNDSKYIVETPFNGDPRGMYQKHNKGGNRLVYTIEELKNQLIKHLKSNKKHG